MKRDTKHLTTHARPALGTLLCAALVALAGCETPEHETHEHQTHGHAPSVDAPARSEGTLPYYSEATFTPAWYGADEVPADFHSIPAFTLLDQGGATVTEADVENRIYVANFFFTDCAGICPSTMASLTRLSDEFSGDPNVAILSHSVMPETDSVQKLAEFAELVGAEAPRWYLLTSEQDAMYELARSAYFADEDLGEGRSGDELQFLHSESFYLVDQDRHIRGIYNGMNAAAVRQLVEDVRTLQAER